MIYCVHKSTPRAGGVKLSAVILDESTQDIYGTLIELSHCDYDKTPVEAKC